MNNKKYIILGSVALVVAFIGMCGYFFIPGVAEYMSFNVLGSATGTDIAMSDVDIASSTDEIATSSINEPSDEQEVVPKKVLKSSVVKKSVSKMEIASVDASANASTTDGAPSPLKNNSSSPIIPTASCLFPSGASSARSREIIFNEIAWMGSVSSSNAEWMEIKNTSASAIDLTGWELLNASGKIKIVFSAGDAIPAGGLLLLSRNNSTTGKLYSGNLVNTGDTLAILDPQCATSDIVDASSGWPAGNNTTKQTMERDADGIGWHTSISSGGTPGAENSAVVPPIPKISTSSTNGVVVPPTIQADTSQPVAPPSPVTSSTDTIATSTDTSSNPSSTINSTSSVMFSHVLIAAIQIAGTSSTNDFVKLYNPTGVSMDLSGWKLHKRSQTGTDYSLKVLPTGSVIAAGQFFTWANSTNGFSETIGAQVSSTETLSADNSVALLDANGAVVDAVAWGTGTSQYGEGSPYPTDPTANQILTRQLVNGSMVDTSNNANDFNLQ